MKLFFLTALVFCTAVAAFGQANTTLSNLVSPTAVNQHLLPNTTNARDLGSSSFSWRNLYLRGYVYLDGTRFVSNAPGTTAFNTFVGSNAGVAVTSGNVNTALGHYALNKTTTGYSNLAIGAYALYTNTGGNNNIAVGTRALYLNAIASRDIAIGDSALFNITQGSYNSALGFQALYSNTTGDNNTALGDVVLYSNISGANNTAVGTRALFANSTGNYNTAVGFDALSVNRSGGANTAIGPLALSENITGESNMALGYLALYLNKNSYNVGVGNGSLFATTNAQYNTAIGFSSGNSYDNGYNNVFVGANTDVNGAGYYNVIAIGQATVCTAPSQVTMGNPATNSYRAYANWSNISDGRYKKNLKENVPGLAFINKLRPITYNLDASGLDQFLHKNQPKEGQPSEEAKAIMDKALAGKEAIIQTGFVAQEVEKAAKEAGYDFSGVDKPKNTNDVYGLRYSEFVVPLVRAVQELDSANQAKDEKIAALEARLNKLEAIITNNSNNALTLNAAYLEQNTPNPVSSTTTIRYHLPTNTTSAILKVTNSKGQLVKSVTLNSSSSQVNLNTSMLTSSTYNYTLFVDGKQIDNKRLIVAR